MFLKNALIYNYLIFSRRCSWPVDTCCFWSAKHECNNNVKKKKTEHVCVFVSLLTLLHSRLLFYYIHMCIFLHFLALTRNDLFSPLRQPVFLFAHHYRVVIDMMMQLPRPPLSYLSEKERLWILFKTLWGLFFSISKWF